MITVTALCSKICLSGPMSYNIEDIQIFGTNMPFISSSEAKNAYFMSGKATNEIFLHFLTSGDEINGIFIPKI